jgi:hypothetical protein
MGVALHDFPLTQTDVRAQQQASRSAYRTRAKAAEVMAESDTYEITVEPGITVTAPRTASGDIRRHKAPNCTLG